MEKMAPAFAMRIMMFAILAFHPLTVFGGDTGINYGRNGDNLPSPRRAIDFISREMNNKISLIRVHDANLEILEPLSGTNLVVTIGVPNEAIAYVASSQEAADKWFQDYIVTYIRKGVSVLGASYPPSQGQFAPGVAQVMSHLTCFLHSIGSPLLINVYPFFALASEPNHIPLDYVLFQSQTPVIIDGNLEYYNLFDAMVDAFLAAMVRAVGREDVKLVVSETGWPTAGLAPYSGIENARIYNSKLREHVVGVGRTPRKADMIMEVYIYEMFNENLVAEGVKRNFGSFYPDFREVYPLWH
ncbi:hypothetical protein QUC31_016668 [Theobroma cacao]